MSVKVGVRVRPFNKRQQQLNCRRCIDMQGNTTHLIADTGQVRSFVYDYSFWSHDKFMVDPDGVYIPVDQKYADQVKVYKEIGSDILVNAWQGYNCCLFAYGQTGSGKSYSMLGYGANIGIIPQVCDKIFTKIDEDKDPKHNYEVRVSMMEIYNETLRDLLVGKNHKKQLKICEHKKLGVYVQGLQKHSVRSYEEIQKKIEQGSNNRSIAATLMNQSSSRSHTIVSINFVQKIQTTASQTSIKYSTIHLVDLAGSESVGKTGVQSKDRLREAAKINQSLSTLGRVIEILADNAIKNEKTFVPYRDSKLTFILRNALGGNSRTAMICAISPANDNYQETLSTLRYAQGAKKIQNKAIVNQSDVDKLIRMLRQENQMLKKMLQQAKFNKTVINQQIISNVNQMNKNMADLGVFEEDDDLLFDLGGDDRDQSFSNDSNFLNISISQKNIKNQTDPYITNLSEDQLLSGRLKYSCLKGLLIGNKNANPRPDVVLAALGVRPQHAKITYQDQNKKLYINICDEQAGDYTFLNGQSIHTQERIELMNMDRLIFGTGCVFLVKIFQGQIRAIKGKIPKTQDIDYTLAISELQNQQQQKSTKSTIAEQQQIRQKVLQEIQSNYQKMKEQNQQQLKERLKQQQALYENQLKQIQQNKQKQMQRLKQQLAAQNQQAAKLKRQRQFVMKEIDHYKILEKQLSESTQNKQQLEFAQIALNQKIEKINRLQASLDAIANKQEKMKEELQSKEVMIRKQLEVKMVLCNNENILNQYKLQLSKKSKSTQQLKDLLIKKQKIELQKKLVYLVPMVEKFNLIAKQMNKNVECGLSINYKYFGEGEIVELLKNSTYQNKLRIYIHVINRNQKRSYFWSVEVFENRFQLALSLFQVFIRSPKDPQINNRETDPYWDPPSPMLIGMAFLSLQTLFYKLKFQGEVSIVNKGSKVGVANIKIYPTDFKGAQDISEQTVKGIVIHNPRDMIQKTLFFVLSIENISLERQFLYTQVQLEYSLPEKSFKQKKYKTPMLNPRNFSYQASHSLCDLSETTIFQLIDKPLDFVLWGTIQVQTEEQLTERDSSQQSSRQSVVSSENIALGSSKERKNPSKFPNKGIIVSNFDVMSKIELDYNNKKQQQRRKSTIAENKKTRPKLRQKDDCLIF